MASLKIKKIPLTDADIQDIVKTHVDAICQPTQWIATLFSHVCTSRFFPRILRKRSAFLIKILSVWHLKILSMRAKF